MIEPETLAQPGPKRRPTDRRAYALAALALVVVAVAAVVFARGVDPSRLGTARPDPNNLPAGPAAPLLGGDAGWINSPPLAATDLAGKVVVYDFWTYSCVNCVRTLPYLRAWHDRYDADGLVIVGVHSPEFDFEKVRANVEAATLRLGVTWPVVLDNRKAIWDRFANQYWPQKHVAGRDGRLRYMHIGEGAYDETEDVLRALLGVDATSPRADNGVQATQAGEAVRAEPAGQAAPGITAETYLGVLRGTAGAKLNEAEYPEPGPLVPGEAALVGRWFADEEAVAARSVGASIVMPYRAREVNLVMTPSSVAGAADVIVELDGRPLAAGFRTADTRVDESGATRVRVDHAGMYRLVLGPAVEEHRLRLTMTTTGISAFAFTFGA